MDKRALYVLIALVILLPGYAAAFSFGDIFDYILDLFGMGGEKPSEGTPKTITCNPPYIRVGNTCCLDANGNRVCDNDETTTTQPRPTTTLSSETTVTSTTTRTTSTTVTTTPAIRCRVNSDCGTAKEEKFCKDGDVYLKKTTPMCQKPGTENSSCTSRISTERYKDCKELYYCVGGECVSDNDTDATTTTTTQPGQTTTTLAAVTPKCGDGILSWHGAGGEEECETPQYPCPSGLQCVNCRCSGCGDGRLQTGEECDNNNKMSRVNGQNVWSGSKHECSGQYQMCDSNCKCTSSVSCQGDLYSSSNCDGRCDPACETCKQYEKTPCYLCEKDCKKLGAGWDDARVCAACDTKHEECKEHDSCDDCYHCVETCPEAMGYYRTAGCNAKCDARLCVKVGSGQYANCYHCKPSVCGDGLIIPPEECEDDLDCPDYHDCNMNCKCSTNCGRFCGGQGVNGYQQKAGVGSEALCKDQMNNAVNALKADCRATCGAYAWMDGISADCCCVDADWKPCLRCPNQNPALIDCNTPLAQCKAGL